MNKHIRILASAGLVTLAQAVSANLTVFVGGENPTCGNSTGYAYAFASGGVPPYSLLWSTSATTDTITGLGPGTYSVTVTDANSDQASTMITLANDPSPVFMDIWPGASLHGCHGLCNNGVWYHPEYMPLNLVPPFSFFPEPVYGVNPFDPDQGAWIGLCDGAQIFTTVTDALGCVAQIGADWSAIGSDPSPMSLVSTTPSCEGIAAGSLTVNVGYEQGAYTPLWNATLLDENMQLVPGHPLFALPLPGQNVETEPGLLPGDYFVERRFQNFQGDCVDLLPVTIPSLGNDCGAVTGTAFMDYNGNCQNNAEPTVPSGVLEIQPGPVYATLSNGSYIVCLAPGNYTLEQMNSDVDEHCTGAPIPFTITASTIPVNVSLPDTSLVPLDLVASIATGPARPGFAFQCGIMVQNTTPSASGAITLTMDFDATLTFTSANPSAANVGGNTVTWNLSQLGGWHHRSVVVNFTVPADPDLIGTQLLNSVSVSSVNVDGDPANNSASVVTTITGSYDPNDKFASTSTAASDEYYFIDQDEWIDYTIRFQNTGTDTAFNILITDTLPMTLDPSTIQMGAGSHPFTWELRDQGTLKFYFQDILLPDSNFSEPLSHGFVGFRILPRPPVLPGTVIENVANIYFDFNPPVITEPSVLVAEFSSGLSDRDAKAFQIFPNPATSFLTVEGVEGAWLRLFTTDGRLVREERITHPLFTIDIEALAPGLYFLQASAEDLGNRTVPFIKH